MERLGLVAENKLYSGDRSNKECGWKITFLKVVRSSMGLAHRIHREI